MPAGGFMLRDIAGTAAAFVLFALFAFVPGYTLAWLLDLKEFRRRGPGGRSALAVAISVGICPAIAYLAGRFAPRFAVWLVFAPLWAGFVWILARERPRLVPRGYRLAKTVAAIWLALGTVSLMDVQLGDRLYYSVIAHDYTMRVAISSAITRGGIPPANPYFFPGHTVPLRYHYFWMALCSLAERLGGSAMNARLAAYGGTLWSGLALLAVIALYLRFVDADGPGRLERRTGIAFALLAVTGLDLLPTLLMAASGIVMPDMEWWNDQVTSWTGTMLWVPHHLASAVACLTGFLLLWDAPARRRDAAAAALAAGLCFASATGCSVYVTLVFAAFLAVWGLMAMLRRQWGDVARLALAGCFAALLVLPTYLQGLRGQASGGAFVVPTVRMFKLPDLILLSVHVAGCKLAVANLLLLPLNYFLEVGFFLAIGLIALRTRKWTRWDAAACAMAGVSILLCTFLRSGVIGNNDLGARGFLPAQFVLLLWAAALWDSPALRGATRPWLRVLMILGVAGTVYQVCQLRFYPIHTEAAPNPDFTYLATDHQFGRRTYAERQVYEQLRSATPPETVLENNPDLDLGSIAYGMYADRQIAAVSTDCGTFLGGDMAFCTQMRPLLVELFSPRAGAPSPAVDQVCRQFGINVLVVRDTDGAWADRESWVWQRRPIAANSLVRALPCGTP